MHVWESRTRDVETYRLGSGSKQERCENAPNNDPTPVARYELKSLGKSTIGWGHITRET